LAEGDPLIISDVPLAWFDDVIKGTCTDFVADFGTLEFTERQS